MTRYKSRFRNLKIPMKKSYTREVGGQTEFIAGRKLEFKETIFETDEQEVIDFLDKDPVCVQMQKNGIFAKVEGEILEAATETLEEKEKRVEEEGKKKKQVRKKPTKKEKGTRKKVGRKKEKPQF